VASALTQVLKLAVRRPRPTQYDPQRGLGSVEHQLSFPSGHTAATAAIAAASATTFVLRHRSSPWRFVVIGAAVAVTALTGYGRVGGGMHFPTDVLAGALLGGSIGVLVPGWHRRPVSDASLRTGGVLRISADRPGLGRGQGVRVAFSF
jgi:undecaprenyl-diphosphatase